METIGQSLPSVQDKLIWPKSNNGPSTRGSGKLAKVAIALDRIFKGRPEIRSESPDYLDGLTETLEALTDEELEWVSDLREGIQTRCKFLPTPADLFELIRERKAKRDQFRPANTVYRKFGAPVPLPPAETAAERKRRVVHELLGYDPDAKTTPVKRVLTPPTAEDLASLKSALPPPGPATPELLKLLAAMSIR